MSLRMSRRALHPGPPASDTISVRSAPLFARWRREGDEAGLATELHVPGPIRCAAFYEDLKRYMSLPIPRPGFTEYYGLFDVAAGGTLPPAPGSRLMVFR